MRVPHILRYYFRSFFFRAQREADLREELQDYLDREIERLRATGLSPEGARHEVMRTFGGVEQIKEACRDANGATFFDALLRDTRIGLRRLARDRPSWRSSASPPPHFQRGARPASIR
jgi:hypothetical protein